MTFKIPKVGFGGKEIDGALERLLVTSEKETPAKKSSKPKKATGSSASLGDEWILLEGRNHGQYSYNHTFVSMHRLGFDADVERATKDLGFSVANTAKEKDGTPYIGNINWEEAIKLNLALGNFTLNPRQAIDLMLDLRAGIKGKKKLYDAIGDEIDGERLKIMYNEIWRKRDPWRAEWLDAKFEEESGRGLLMHSNHELLPSKEILSANRSYIGNGYLQQDTFMSLEDINENGLPTKANAKSSVYFYYPRNGAVARFYADSVRAFLDCNWDPSGRYDRLGVRAARAKN